MTSIWILAVLAFNIAVSEWLVKRTVLKHLGVALLVILVTAVTANLGIIPSSDVKVEVYDQIFSIVAPLAIFFLLLEVNLKNLKEAGPMMIIMFLVGSLATMLAVLVADLAIDGKERLGPLHHAVSGMFTGTYTGGSINFNAVALHYGVNEDGVMYATSVAIDNIATTLWMMASLSIPKLLQNRFPHQKRIIEGKEHSAQPDDQLLNIKDVSILLGTGLIALLVSETGASFLADRGYNVPSILILTTISLILAQINYFSKLKGSRFLGLLGVYLFLAVIGAYCNLSALAENGDLAIVMTIFVFIIVLIHAILIYGAGRLLKADWDIVSIASQANIGGSTSALALAESLKRHDLILAAILIGTLGNGIGTYLGFLVAGLLG